MIFSNSVINQVQKLIPILLFTVLISACDQKAKVEKKTEDPKLSGSIRVLPELAEKLAPSDVLYVILRKQSDPSGAPIAVKRITSPNFPLNFEIGPNDQMIPGGKFEGPFILKAKISKSGDAISAPGDLQGFSNTKDLKRGQKDITVIIDDVIKGS